jgi:hypothetical protein
MRIKKNLFDTIINATDADLSYDAQGIFIRFHLCSRLNNDIFADIVLTFDDTEYLGLHRSETFGFTDLLCKFIHSNV